MGEKHRVKRKVLRDTYKNGRPYGYVGETPTKTARSPTKTGEPNQKGRVMIRKVVLLTNEFPLGNESGEIYLNSEINLLADIFEEVIVCPTDSNENQGKSLNNNVKVIKGSVRSRKKNRIYCVFKALLMYMKKSYKSLEYELQDEYVELDSIAKKFYFYFFEAKAEEKFKRLYKKISMLTQKTDELVIYAYRFYDLSRLALLLKEYVKDNNMKIICIARAHGYDLYEYRNKMCYLPQRNYLLKNLDAVFPCSKDGCNYLKRRKLGNIYVSYLGSEDWGVESYTKADDNVIRLISCSTVTPVKQVIKICEAIHVLNMKGYKVEWTHCGDGSEMKEIENYRDKLMKENRIALLGNVSHDKVINQYIENCYDLFINVSKSEGIPQAIMEAVSFGIPVIATNVGGNKEIVENNVNGFLIQNENIPIILADQIEKYFLLNNEEKIRFRFNTRKSWEKNFQSKVNAEEFLEKICGMLTCE